MSCKENDNIILDQEHDNEETITLKEFIEAEDALEKEARAAYPGKFDCCTYGLGYIRQSLYACRSCLEGFEGGENKEAVICYACSVACHPSCDLIELGVRRHLRCDCGNSLFTSKPIFTRSSYDFYSPNVDRMLQFAKM